MLHVEPRLFFIVSVCLSLAASAHEGDEHPAQPRRPTAPATPGSAFHFPKEAQFLLGVRTEPVALRTLETRMKVPGKVVPRTDRYAELSSPVPGRVLAREGNALLVGQTVKKGQLLATVEQSLSAPEGAQLSAERIQAEAAVSQARAALEQSRKDAERQRGLRGVVAEKDIQKAELELHQAEQELSRAQRQRELYGDDRKVTRFELRSPIDGVLVEAGASLGAQVELGRPLFKVLDASVVWVEAAVFADDVGRVEQAKQGLVHVDAYPERYFPATLFNVSPVVDEASRSVKVLFEVGNAEGKLRPGMFASVQIGEGTAQQVLAVRDSAVVQLEGRTAVFLHTGPESFSLRDVRLGRRDGAYRAVEQGLEEGERVVIEGTYPLRSASGR